MTWRSLAVLLATAVSLACSPDGAERDPDTRPEVTVMGTTTDQDQPGPTLGPAISTER